MAVRKYLKNNSGMITEESSINTSAGAADEGKIPALNASGILDATIINSVSTSVGAGDTGKVVALDGSGKIDTSMMPTGIGADTAAIATSETLASGDLVNIWSNGGVFNVRKADATSAGAEAHGFVLAGFTHPTTATVYFEGQNTAVTGLTPGVQYLSSSVAGGATATPPSGSGNIVQRVGFATSATAMNFQANQPIVLA